jgi:hypothetical protein
MNFGKAICELPVERNFLSEKLLVLAKELAFLLQQPTGPKDFCSFIFSTYPLAFYKLFHRLKR